MQKTNYFCDRCGKRFNEMDRSCEHIRIGKIAEKNSPFKWSSRWDDLCAKCSAELELWLNDKEATVICKTT